MSTKTTIWFGIDDKGRECHLYWELGERVPFNGAPIYLEIEADGREVSIRLPKDVGQKIRDILAPDDSWEIL